MIYLVHLEFTPTNEFVVFDYACGEVERVLSSRFAWQDRRCFDVFARVHVRNCGVCAEIERCHNLRAEHLS